MRGLQVITYDLQGINDRDGRVAQSVEQRIENPRVTGSIPVPATIFFLIKSILSYVSS